VTFIAYVYVDDPKEIQSFDHEKYRDTKIGEGEISRNFMNCVFIFVIQMVLITLAA
jgi:hypothetical protein